MKWHSHDTCSPPEAIFWACLEERSVFFLQPLSPLFDMSHSVGIPLHKLWLPEVVRFNHLLLLMNALWFINGVWVEAPPSSGCGGNTTWQLPPWLMGYTGSQAKQSSGTWTCFWGWPIFFKESCLDKRPYLLLQLYCNQTHLFFGHFYWMHAEDTLNYVDMQFEKE